MATSSLLGWPIGKMPPFDQNWSSLSQALHTSLSIGIWQRSGFHRRKWQQINKMDKRDVILSDQAACRYDENNRYSLLYSSCHHHISGLLWGSKRTNVSYVRVCVIVPQCVEKVIVLYGGTACFLYFLSFLSLLWVIYLQGNPPPLKCWSVSTDVKRAPPPHR